MSAKELCIALFLFSFFCGCSLATLPQVAIDHNARGAELLAEGRLDEAEARFRLALEYRSNFAEAHANLGLLAFAREDLPTAERELREAIGLNADFGLAWAGLGSVYEAQHDDDRAIDAYHEALSVDPGIIVARRNLVFALARRGDFEDARAQALRLVAVDARDADVLAVLAWCELRLARVLDAAAHVRAALELDRHVPRAWFVEGALRMRAHRYQDARAAFARAEGEPELRDVALAHQVLCELADANIDAAMDLLRRLGAPGARLLAALEGRAAPDADDGGEVAQLFADVLSRAAALAPDAD